MQRRTPGGYCGLGGTGVSCPIGVGSSISNGEAVDESISASAGSTGHRA